MSATAGEHDGPAIDVHVGDAEATRDIGRALSALLRPGDLVVLSGGLGAGKTTFTQGLGAGLGVRGDITSPTFVIARVHPSLGDGPALVHVDAYRLQPSPGAALELDDLDLDASADDAVTVVEWGAGLAEVLSEDRLEIDIARESWTPEHQPTDEERVVRVRAVGPRWEGVDLGSAFAVPGGWAVLDRAGRPATRPGA